MEQTAAVVEPAAILWQLPKPLLGQIVANHALNRVLQLAAVGARVHPQSAADRAGDAGGKLQPAQPLFTGKGCELGETYPGLGVDGAVGQQKELLQLFRAQQQQIRQTLVGKENVAAVAERHGRDAVILHNGAEL